MYNLPRLKPKTMASSSDSCSSKSLLISKVLHSGDSIKIGRKSTCEVMVKSPFISGTHCRIDVSRSRPAGDETSKRESLGDLRFFVSDLSSNGTWLLRDPARTINCSKQRLALKSVGANVGKSAKKLGKTKEEFLPGDCILLLAPAHQECMRYRFTVKRKGSEYILEQLPATLEWNKEVAAAATKSSKDLKVNKSESAVVGKKRSASSGSNDARKKHCGYSLSEAR